MARSDRNKSNTEAGINPARERNPSRTRLFWAITLLLPLFFFVAIEGGLRVFNYGDDYPLFTPISGYPDFLNLNDEVSLRYFPNKAGAPTGNVEIFDAEKPARSLRIVVQGGSSAAGFPFYRGGSFPRMLEQRLRNTFPGRQIDVINTSMAAVNTYTLLDFVDEIIAIQPDAVLIYAGHNEYYGALGVGSTVSLGTSPGLIRLYLGLRSLRTVQLLTSMVRGITLWFGSEGPGDDGTLMQRMVREQSIPLESSAFMTGREQFETNLERIVGKYRERGIPVFIGTLASNEKDQPPFENLLKPDTDTETWNERYGILESMLLDSTAVSPELARELVSMDSTSARAWFILGKTILTADSSESGSRIALDAFRKARDLDPLRFRAPTQFNSIVRKVAEQHGATVVEVEERLRRASARGIVGHETMLEHLHPNMDGYLLVADAFYSSLLENLLSGIPSQPVTLGDARQQVIFSPADSLTAAFRVENLVSNWPFTAPGEPDISVHNRRGVDVPEQIALALFRNEGSWYDSTNDLVGFYEENGDFARALAASNAIIDEYPITPKGYLNACQIFLKVGQYDAAMEMLEQASLRASAEEASGFFLDAGMGLVALERPEAAFRFIQRAHDRLPSAETNKMLGTLLLNQSQNDQNAAKLSQAMEYLERAFEINPTDIQTMYNLAGGYVIAGNYAKGQEIIAAMRKLYPDNTEVEALARDLGF